MNETGAGWKVTDSQLYTKMFTCECPMLEKAGNSKSLTWCHCTSGYSKKMFEQVFDTTVEVEVLESIRQGADFCLMKVTIN